MMRGETLNATFEAGCTALHATPVTSNVDPAGLSPQDSPGKNTGGGCHALLQGIFPPQGSHLCVPHVSCTGRWFFATSTTWEVLKIQ